MRQIAACNPYDFSSKFLDRFSYDNPKLIMHDKRITRKTYPDNLILFLTSLTTRYFPYASVSIIHKIKRDKCGVVELRHLLTVCSRRKYRILCETAYPVYKLCIIIHIH